MKNVLFLLAFCAVQGVCAETFSSPDGRVSCAFTLEDGRPAAAVSFAGRLAFRMDLGLERGRLTLRETKKHAVSRAWQPVWGFRKTYPEQYTECVVTLEREGRSGKEPPSQTLVLRCYNEGFAARTRFVMEPYCVSRIEGERTRWRFSPGAAAWAISRTEGTYPQDPLPLEKLDASKRWHLPLTVRTAEGFYASLFEADAQDFPRSYLRVQDGVLSTQFVMGGKEGRGETFTPWRAVALAATPAELVERAYFIAHLNPPCAIADTSWIKPGFCVSDEGNFPLRTPEILAVVDAVRQTGAKYVQIDWGWYGTEHPWTDDDRRDYALRHPELKDDATWTTNTYANPFRTAVGTVPYHPYWPYSGRKGVTLDMPAIVAAFAQHGIGVCLYVHGAILEKYDLDELFATYAKWGIAGLKPGFVGYGSQDTTTFIRRMVRTAAKYRLWLDIHDAHVPDGMERTWPNLMITEGGGGEEGDHPVCQDVALPFTRCLVGPFDYTPFLFRAGRAQATKLHKLAMFLVYPGSTAVMRGRIGALVKNDAPAAAFLCALPWTYDDTRVFDAAIGRHLTVMRRKGDIFYLAGLSGQEAHETALTLDFLEAGRAYDLEWLCDDLSCKAALRGYVRRTRRVRRGDVLTVKMDRAGGFCAILRPAGASDPKTHTK